MMVNTQLASMLVYYFLILHNQPGNLFYIYSSYLNSYFLHHQVTLTRKDVRAMVGKQVDKARRTVRVLQLEPSKACADVTIYKAELLAKLDEHNLILPPPTRKIKYRPLHLLQGRQDHFYQTATRRLRK